MPVDVLKLSYLAHDAMEGKDPEPFRAMATPEAIAEICRELLAARMVVTAARACEGLTDRDEKRKAWGHLRSALYSVHRPDLKG